MKFSEKIVRLRKIKGITQDEFASAVGVSRQAVYKWECGQSYPEASKLVEIKALFGISIDDLLDDSYEVALPEKKKRKRISRAKDEKTEKAVEKEISPKKSYVETENEPEKITVVEVEAEPVIEVSEARDDVIENTGVTEETNTQETTDSQTVTDEAENIIEELSTEKIIEESTYAAATAPSATEKKAPDAEEKKEEKKRGFFSRIFGRR